MVKFIYERAVNFEDLLAIAVGNEEVKLDALINKNFSTKLTAATEKEAEEIFQEFSGIEKLTEYKIEHDFEGVQGKAILISLLIFIIQKRKSFTIEQANQIVALLNKKDNGLTFDLSNPVELFKQIVAGTTDIPSPGYSKEQLKTFENHYEMIFYVGICLTVYFFSDVMSNYLISSFTLYLEAIKSDCKFLDELKAWNPENTFLSKTIAKIENFIFGRNNSKSKSTIEESKYTLFLSNFERDLASIKRALKEYLSVELNQSTKSYFYESDICSVWRNLCHPFQALTQTISNSYSVQLFLVDHLVNETLEGDQKEKAQAKISECRFENPKTNNCFHVILANNENIKTLVDLVSDIFSLSTHRIEQREVADLNNPNNKKKKLSFKLGKGPEFVMQEILGCLRQEEPADKKAAPEETQKKVLKPYKTLKFKPTCLVARSKISEFYESKNQERRRPKVAKGVRDTDPKQMRIKTQAFNIIKEIFNKHGGVEIDTPIFELKETLLGKYGEEGGKLIYDLSDQGGELLSLRYDLTVPFARYLATNNVKKIKRFHLGKVYRRDQPDMNRGRFREFYQCDLDIAGQYEPMVVDAEILTIIHEIFIALDCGKFEIKLSHRGLLEGIVCLAGAPLSKFKTICSSIDKLDKEPWSAVESELVNEKGIDPAAVAKIKVFVENRNKIDDLVAKVEADKLFEGHETSIKAIEELKLLSKYLKMFGAYDSITLDLALARGLDYYTGLIYEIVIEGSKVGSVGAGGRYDNLVGMFGPTEIPCIGMSVGIERIFVLLEEKYKKMNRPIRESETHFMIATIGKELMDEKMKLLGELWKNNFKSEIVYEKAPKPQKQLSAALESQIPFIIWLGEDEIKEGIVKIKVVFGLSSVHLPKRGIHRQKRGSPEET